MKFLSITLFFLVISNLVSCTGTKNSELVPTTETPPQTDSVKDSGMESDTTPRKDSGG